MSSRIFFRLNLVRLSEKSNSFFQECRKNVPKLVRSSKKSDKSDFICRKLKVVLTQLKSKSGYLVPGRNADSALNADNWLNPCSRRTFRHLHFLWTHGKVYHEFPCAKCNVRQAWWALGGQWRLHGIKRRPLDNEFQVFVNDGFSSNLAALNGFWVSHALSPTLSLCYEGSTVSPSPEK